MGIKTTSFPHLGLYGDQFVLNNNKGERVVCEDHTSLKEKQEKYEKWQAHNAKKIQQVLQKPNVEEGETIVELADDVYPYEKEYEEETVPQLLKPNLEEGESVVTIADEIPFIGYYSPKKPEPSECWHD
jgi:hypothetical protein